MSVLDQILAHDAHTADVRPSSDNHAASRLCVVTCSDPSVTALLPRALGIGLEELVLVRLPGPAVRSGSEELTKAVAVALAFNGCDEVLVVGHTDCTLVSMQASAAASALSSRGFDRARLPEDVRTFFNLQASPRQIATETASAIRNAGYMPPGLLVHAAVLDNATGRITVLERGEHHASAAARPADDIFGASGPAELAGGLPEGLGVGVSTAFDSEASGPVELAVELPPHQPIETRELDIPRTELLRSDIELKASAIDIQPSQLDFQPSVFEIGTPANLQSSPIALDTPLIDVQPASFVGASIAPPAPRQTEGPSALPKHAPPRAAPRPAPSRAPQRAAPPRAQPAPARSQPMPVRAPESASRRLPPDLAPKIDKVRDFYRMELDPTVRAEVARNLGEAVASGSSNSELIKLAFRPVLESGPKRYKVIDELLAIKEAASTMDRDGCHSVLRQLVV